MTHWRGANCAYVTFSHFDERAASASSRAPMRRHCPKGTFPGRVSDGFLASAPELGDRAVCIARAITSITGNVRFSTRISGIFRSVPVAISMGCEANSLFLDIRELAHPQQGIRPPRNRNPAACSKANCGTRPFERDPCGEGPNCARAAIVADAVAVNRPSPHRRGAPGDLAFCSALRPRPGSGDLFSWSSSRTLATVRTRVARSGGGPVSSTPGRLDRHGRPFHFQTRLMFLCLAGGLAARPKAIACC